MSVFALSTVSGVGGRDGDTISLYQSRMGNYNFITLLSFGWIFFCILGSLIFESELEVLSSTDF